MFFSLTSGFSVVMAQDFVNWGQQEWKHTIARWFEQIYFFGYSADFF